MSKAERAMRILEQGFDEATAVMSIPEKYRKRLRTTNSQERLNEEVRHLLDFRRVDDAYFI
ncbi:transposase [Paenibacillus thiaminolyticus]|nr:transposase [Paenibacillus thiaminolyticus]WCF06798.1 transposase [Paenibacillus thiaminolyticus]